eukprot:3904019-Rhodomonas_salina.4
MRAVWPPYGMGAVWTPYGPHAGGRVEGEPGPHLEERLSHRGGEFGQAVDILGALERVGGEVCRESKPEHGRGVEAPDQRGLVLRPADLVPDAPCRQHTRRVGR